MPQGWNTVNTLPNYASAIVGTEEILASISALVGSSATATASMGIQEGIHR
jgi:hypothetical protein